MALSESCSCFWAWAILEELVHSLEILCGYGLRREEEEGIKERTECFDGTLFRKIVLIVG